MRGGLPVFISPLHAMSSSSSASSSNLLPTSLAPSMADVDAAKRCYEALAQGPRFSTAFLAAHPSPVPASPSPLSVGGGSTVKFWVQSTQKDVKRMVTRKGLLSGVWMYNNNSSSSNNPQSGAGGAGGEGSKDGEQAPLLSFKRSASSPAAASAPAAASSAAATAPAAYSHVMTFPLPCDMEGVTNFALDPTGTRMAVARTAPSKEGKPVEPVIEIWSSGILEKTIKASGKHGTVYEPENNFSGMSWSSDGQLLLYAAEEYQPEGVAFFDASSSSPSSGGKGDTVPGTKYVKKESWGEALATTVRPTIVILHVASETFSFPLSSAALGNSLAAGDKLPVAAWGQPVWAPRDCGIVCVGYHFSSRKMGLKFCLNRRSSIFFFPLTEPIARAASMTSVDSLWQAGSTMGESLGTNLLSQALGSVHISGTGAASAGGASFPLGTLNSASSTSLHGASSAPRSFAIIPDTFVNISESASSSSSPATTFTAARSPMFTPDGCTLVWLENVVGGPHAAPSRLMKQPWKAIAGKFSSMGFIHAAAAVAACASGDASSPAASTGSGIVGAGSTHDPELATAAGAALLSANVHDSALPPTSSSDVPLGTGGTATMKSPTLTPLRPSIVFEADTPPVPLLNLDIGASAPHTPALALGGPSISSASNADSVTGESIDASAALATASLPIPAALDLSSSTFSSSSLLSPSPPSQSNATPSLLSTPNPAALPFSAKTRAASVPEVPPTPISASYLLPQVVVDIVHDHRSVGIYGERLPSSCFTSNTELLITTYHRSSRVVVHVDVATGVMAPVHHHGIPKIEEGACDILFASPLGIVASFSSLSTPHTLYLGRIDGVDIHWTQVTESRPIPGLTHRVLTFKNEAADTEWEALVLEKEDGFVSRGARPLVAIPHGGPHSSFASEYFPVFAGLANLGFVVLLVNYRGSLSFGQRSIDSLLGNVGVQDVADVDAAVSRALESGLADPSRVCVYGGSHGGLLGAHLTAQRPQRYKAAVLRNPVVDLASMAGITDIPDWCFVEAGLTGHGSNGGGIGVGGGDAHAGGGGSSTATSTIAAASAANPDLLFPLTGEAFATMMRASPIAHVDGVRAPTLLMLGGQDLRVPPSQGLAWYRAIAARGVVAKVLWFPDEGHALASLACEAECFVQLVCWLKVHMK